MGKSYASQYANFGSLLTFILKCIYISFSLVESDNLKSHILNSGIYYISLSKISFGSSYYIL